MTQRSLSVVPADSSAAVANSVFNAARALFAPDAVVHLGAGTGQGVLHQWRQWSVPASLVVDAQFNRMSWAKDWAAVQAGRYVSGIALSAGDELARFQIASNPDESGLLDAEALTALWPHLKPVESVAVESMSMDGLLAQTGSGALLQCSNLWLLVDFFCTAEFWLGAQSSLELARVVVIRQSKTVLKAVETPEDCNTRMAKLDFVHAGTLESNHPQVVHHVYFRSLERDLESALYENAVLRQDKAALGQKENALVTETSALSQAVTVLERTCQEQDKAKERAIAQRDDQVRAAAVLAAKLDESVRAYAAQVVEKEALSEELAALKAANEAQAQAHAQVLVRLDQEAKAQSALADELEKERTVSAALLLEKAAAAKNQAALEMESAALFQEVTVLRVANEAYEKSSGQTLAQRDEQAKACVALRVELDAAQAAHAALHQENLGLLEEKTKLALEKSALQEETSALKAKAEALSKARDLALTQRDKEANAKVQTEGKLAEEGSVRAALTQEKALLVEDKGKLEKEKSALKQGLSALKDAFDAEVKVKDQVLAQRHQEAKAKAELAEQLASEKKQHAAALQEKSTLTQGVAALTQEVASLQQEAASLKQEADTLKQESLALNNALEAELLIKEQVIVQRNQEAQEKADALKAKAHLVEVSDDRKQKLENARKELQASLAAQDRIKEEMQSELESELKIQADKALAQRNEVAQAVQAMKAENDELRVRQSMIQEELIKAEAQIELIKDLLIRGPGL